jgi:hypothetical protein
MNRISLTKNLFLDEYIPKSVYKKYINKPWILIGLIDNRLIKADQLLRDYFGEVTINNWFDGGIRNWSGLRTSDSPEFAPESQHTFGRASDKIFKNATAEEVREYIKNSYKTLGITCIEDKVTWVHSDVRNTTENKLLIV